MPRPATPSKRPQLTLAQLAAYDDILTDALVDHVGYTSSIDFFAVQFGVCANLTC